MKMSVRIFLMCAGLSIVFAAMNVRARSAFTETSRVTIDELDSVRGWNVRRTFAGYKSEISFSGDVRRSGEGALKLEYHFLPLQIEGNFIGYHKMHRLPKDAQRVSFWLKGDGSGNPVGLLFLDAHEEYHLYRTGLLDTTQWEERSVPLASSSKSWGGDFDGVPLAPLSFHSFYVEPAQKDKETTGTFYVDMLSVEAPMDSLPQLVCRVESEKVGNIFTTDEPIEFNLVMDNMSTGTRTLIVDYEIRDTEERRLHHGSIQTNVDGGKKESQHLQIPVKNNGCFWLALKVYSPAGALFYKETIPYSRVFPTLQTTRNPLFGVCTHFGQNKGDIDVNLYLAALGGFRWIRDEMEWRFAEQVRGKIRVLPWWEQYVKKAREHGLEVLLTLNYGNPLYEEGKPPVTQEGLDAFSRYCMTFIRHFKGQIDYFEVWNEYNIGPGQGRTPEDYARMLKKVYRDIKRTNPDSFVVGGSVAGYGFEWLERVYNASGLEAMDAVSIIPHFYPRTPEQENVFSILKTLQARTSKDGKEKPVWISETGYPTHRWSNGVTEKMSGACLVRLFVGALVNNVPQKIFWYNLQNDGNHPIKNEMNFGLVRCWQDEIVPFAAKENFVAVNTLTHKLDGMEFERTLQSSENLFVHIFRNARETSRKTVILWTDKRIVDIGIKADVPSLIVSDMNGNETLLHPYRGVFTLSATDYPVYIEGAFDTFELCTPSFNVLNPSIDVVAGDVGSFEISLPADTGLSYRFVLPADIAMQREERSPEKGKNTLRSSFKVPLTTPRRLYEMPMLISHDDEVVGRLSGMINVRELFDVTTRPQVVVKEGGHEWQLVIEVYNNSKEHSYSGRIVPVEPKAWVVQHEPVAFGEIEPSGYWTTTMNAPPGDDGDVIAVTFDIELPGRWRQEIIKRFNLLVATRAVSPVSIDGGIEDWKDAIGFRLDKRADVHMIPDWSGKEDLSATGFIKWDDENLYLCVEVIDDVFTQKETGGDIWKGDSIQFALDFMREHDDIRKGHHEFGFALSNDTRTGWRWFSAFEMPVGRFDNAKVAIVPSQNGMIYELAFPWSDILPANRKPYPGEVFGFGLIVNDTDNDSTRGWIEYMQGIGLTKDPNLLGEAVLSP